MGRKDCALSGLAAFAREATLPVTIWIGHEPSSSDLRNNVQRDERMPLGPVFKSLRETPSRPVALLNFFLAISAIKVSGSMSTMGHGGPDKWALPNAQICSHWLTGTFSWRSHRPIGPSILLQRHETCHELPRCRQFVWLIGRFGMLRHQGHTPHHSECGSHRGMWRSISTNRMAFWGSMSRMVPWLALSSRSTLSGLWRWISLKTKCASWDLRETACLVRLARSSRSSLRTSSWKESKITSASHEKSPTEKHTHTQDSTPQQQKPSFVCDRGASLCNPGPLAGEFNVSIQKWMVPSDGPNPSRPNRASGWHKPTKSPDRRLTVGKTMRAWPLHRKRNERKVCGRYAPTNLTLLCPTSFLCGDRSGWLRHDRRRKITISFQML